MQISNYFEEPMTIRKAETEPTPTPAELIKARNELGLSMAEASRLCRIPYRTWQNWEHGSRPMPSYALTLIEYLKMTINTDNTWVTPDNLRGTETQGRLI